jgi:predicted metal-dependent phosphoesterase TrpH
MVFIERAAMKLDAHVHTCHSGMTTIWPLSLIMRESYNTPHRAYLTAKARGMDLVAITDHDVISGALEIAHLPDVIVGSEVSARFPAEGVDVHLGVLDITERQHQEIQRRRANVADLLPYLRDESIFTVVNHVASQVNGRLTPAHIASLMPWVNAFEVINGSRLPSQNRTAAALAEATCKARVGGSDAHTGRGIGYTCTVVDGVGSKEAFMEGLWSGRGRAEGSHGSYFTMASDIVRFAGRFYQERARRLWEKPLEWHRLAFVIGGTVGMPLVCLPLAAAAAHFIEEARFNRSLLFDLVARPAIARSANARLPEAA